MRGVWALALLLAASPGAARAPAAYPLACVYASRTDGVVPTDRCAAATADGFLLTPAVLTNLAYARGLASVAIEGNWYYRRRDGRMQRMVTFEMGPDYFVGGLARAVVDGRLAYVDRRLRVRVATRFDWGEPFANGRAAVCVGCVERMVDGGEHSYMEGGRWSVIDRRGREVAPAASRRT